MWVAKGSGRQSEIEQFVLVCADEGMDFVASLEIGECDASGQDLVLKVTLQGVVCFFQITFAPRQICALDL
jgi:hypothetical protein